MASNWLGVLVPMDIFLIMTAFGLSLRLAIKSVFTRRPNWAPSPVARLLIRTTWQPFSHWFILLGACFAIKMSALPPDIKDIAGNVIASILILYLMWWAVSLSEKMISLYMTRLKVSQSPTSWLLAVARCGICSVGILTILDIWGAPMEPVMLVLGAGFFIAGLGFRDTIADLFCGFELASAGQIKLGEHVRLESGETGRVAEITWRNAIIKTTEGHSMLVPNRKLVRGTVINYGTNGIGHEILNDRSELLRLRPGKALDTLSDRELEVLRLVGAGATNHEIAKKLVVSENTVKSHLRTIMNKLNLRNRQQAAAFAEREGLMAGASPEDSDSNSNS